MSAADRSKRRRRGEFKFVFGRSNEIIGVIEQRPDGLWLATAAGGRQLGLCNTIEAAIALVQEETARG
jgi:hypothetical protein